MEAYFDRLLRNPARRARRRRKDSFLSRPFRPPPSPPLPLSLPLPPQTACRLRHTSAWPVVMPSFVLMEPKTHATFPNEIA